MSTISAALNSLAAVTLEDYIKPLNRFCGGKEISDTKSVFLGKVLALGFGFLCIILAFVAELLGGVLQVKNILKNNLKNWNQYTWTYLQASLSIFGVVGGPLLGLFTLGMISESTNQKGAVTGTLGAVSFLLWIAFGQPRPILETLPLDAEECKNRNFSNILNNSSILKTDVLRYTHS